MSVMWWGQGGGSPAPGQGWARAGSPPYEPSPPAVPCGSGTELGGWRVLFP